MLWINPCLAYWWQLLLVVHGGLYLLWFHCSFSKVVRDHRCLKAKPISRIPGNAVSQDSWIPQWVILWKTNKTIGIHYSLQNHETCSTLGATVQVFALLVFLEWWHLHHFESIGPLCSDSSSHFFCDFINWRHGRNVRVSSKLYALGMGWKTIPYQAKNSAYYFVLPDLSDSSLRSGRLLTQCGGRVSIKINKKKEHGLFQRLVLNLFWFPDSNTLTSISACAHTSGWRRLQRYHTREVLSPSWFLLAAKTKCFPCSWLPKEVVAG